MCSEKIVPGNMTRFNAVQENAEGVTGRASEAVESAGASGSEKGVGRRGSDAQGSGAAQGRENGEHASSPSETNYLRPALGEWVTELEIKKSRFIGIARRTETENDVRAFIADVTKRYPTARHHCTAYILHSPDALPIERSNDDGEPSGTAGQPMLDVIRGSGLRDVTVVVVRYFGGVKLGTGGLVRAYHDTAKAVLGQARVVRREHKHLYRVAVDHTDAGRVESELRNDGNGVEVVGVDYAAQASITLAADAGHDVAGLVARITSGGAQATAAGARWVDTLTR